MCNRPEHFVKWFREKFSNIEVNYIKLQQQGTSSIRAYEDFREKLGKHELSASDIALLDFSANDHAHLLNYRHNRTIRTEWTESRDISKVRCGNFCRGVHPIVFQ
jgi:hypothetical protein